ncbi:sensor histidine kinase [Aliidiomarina soli]|uniref:histidine kinase n=1 Tax=Aliidiomarina soli TaxID=1928574 RepID=A0A432WEM1_9GAMM|nr:ATP-binding protein [Aliidiomarina soli]RUO31258.1 hypothetical protein CWE14_12265 [Aliidiomarina soli]
MDAEFNWVEQVPAPYLVMDSSNCIVAVNEACLTLLGYGNDELIGVSFSNLMNKANWLAWHNMVQPALDSGKPAEQYSMRLQQQNGEPVSLLLSAKQQSDVIHLTLTPYETRINMERSLIAQRNEVRESAQALTREQASLLARQSQQAELIRKLEDVNSNFVQTEKMAAIGQLAAGVAHEINNPIGYVYSNLQTMAEYVDDLRQIIEAIDHVDSVDELKRLKKTLDYDFIRTDVSALLRESEEGIERVKHIITALKDFSRQDECEMQRANINKAVETTISVAWNELKYKAEVHTSLADIPDVCCNLGQINQVFMNLLVNAAQAIEKFGNIYVETVVAGDTVEISIRDDGSGISDEQMPRIFEPFYTSKPVGEGTGLGLALTYNIVKKHGGTLRVDSKVGQGTCFTVVLPVAGIQQAQTEA